jgi:hypothetical protein
MYFILNINGENQRLCRTTEDVKAFRKSMKEGNEKGKSAGQLNNYGKYGFISYFVVLGRLLALHCPIISCSNPLSHVFRYASAYQKTARPVQVQD